MVTWFIYNSSDIDVDLETTRLVRQCLAGLDINCKEPIGGNTSLHMAAESQDVEQVLLLLKFGAKVDALNYNLETVLHKFCQDSDEHVHLPTIKILIENGVDVYSKDKQGRNFLHHLLKKDAKLSGSRFEELADILLEKNCLNIFNIHEDSGLYTPLHYAVAYTKMSESAAKLLHSNGVNFNAVSDCGNCLHFAILGMKSVKFLSLLVNEFQVDWKFLDGKKASVLHHAAFYGHVEALGYLIQLEGLDINGLDTDGETPLHCSSSSENLSKIEATVNLLLENGCRREVRNKDGLTAYDIAVYRNKNNFILDKAILDALSSVPD